MKTTEQENALISKYLRNSISQEEKMVFDGKLKSDNFRMELLNQAKLIDALHLADEALIKDGFKNLDDKIEKTNNIEKSHDKNSFSKIIKGLLLLLAVLAAFYFGNEYLNKNESTSNPGSFAALIDSHRFRYNNFENKRSTDASIEIESFSEAFKFYVDGNYQASLDLFKDAFPQTPQVKLYIANCYIDLKDFEKGKLELSNISSSDSDINENKEWYSILCDLGLGNKEQCNNALDVILKNPSHLFYGKAIQLQKELNPE